MLYEVLLRQSYFEQQVLNRWHYASTVDPTTVSGAFAIAFALGFIVTGDPLEPPAGTLFDALQDIQVPELEYQECQVQALYDPLDFFTVAYTPVQIGVALGADMSPVASLGFRSNRVRTDIRRGFKRFSGVSESAFTTGGEVDSGYDVVLAEVAARMSETITYTEDGDAGSFVPCVLQFEMYTTPPAKKAYRKYATLAEQLDHAALSVSYSPYSTMRTQNSRQYGRGA